MCSFNFFCFKFVCFLKDEVMKQTFCFWCTCVQAVLAYTAVETVKKCQFWPLKSMTSTVEFISQVNSFKEVEWPNGSHPDIHRLVVVVAVVVSVCVWWWWSQVRNWLGLG